eukprot:4472898-Pyramimonas_sp.AAC.1
MTNSIGMASDGPTLLRGRAPNGKAVVHLVDACCKPRRLMGAPATLSKPLQQPMVTWKTVTLPRDGARD